MPAQKMGRSQRRQRRVERKMQRRRVAAQRFTEPITGKRARRISKAEAFTAYRPTERQIQSEIKGSAIQGRNLGHWYNTFAQQLDQSRQQTAAAYQQANADLQGVMNTANVAAQQVGSGLSQEAAQRQATTGIEGDPRISAMRQAAAAQSASFGAALQAPMIGQAANQFAFQTNQADYSRREGLEQRLKERRRREAKQADLLALRKERGQYRITKLDELRKAERDYQIQRAATGIDRRKAAQEELEGRFERGTKKRELAEKAQERREDRRQRELENRQEQEKIGVTKHGERREQEEYEHPGKSGGGGLTAGERRGIKEGRQSALAAARTNIGEAGWPDNAKEENQLIAKVADEEEVSPAEARWAVKRLMGKHQARTEVRRRREHQGKIPGAGFG
jgi:hypothetical protein